MTDLPPLRPYQAEAVQRCLDRGKLLLAMTMGSGKTRVAIETVEALALEYDCIAGAVFVQNSTKFQWEREIKQWAPDADVLVINGPKNKRAAQYEEAYSYRYTVLNYEALVHDWELIKEHLPCEFIIADECTNVKSFRAKKSRHLKAFAKGCDYRIGMSGQPVENRPEELFSIMEFVDPTVLGRFDKFDRTFISRDPWGRPRSYKNLALLNSQMSEAMFRRSREDIAKFLPKVVTVDTPVPLDTWSQKLYEYIRLDLLDVLEMAMAAGMGGFDLMSNYGRGEGAAEANQFKGLLMARVTAMRLLCDHPQLLLKSAEDFDDDDVAGGSQYAASLRDAGRLKGAPATSSKLEALMEKVTEILDESRSNKVVIFSGFKAMLGYIGADLKTLGHDYALLTGDIPASIRDTEIVRFNVDPKCRVFLSSDAGAYGVNLNAGTHLISYDLPWSAGSFAQRVARIDRTSSLHSSIVIDSMFARGTIEERQLDMLIQKRRISEAFIDGRYNDKGQLPLSLESLREFLSAT